MVERPSMMPGHNDVVLLTTINGKDIAASHFVSGVGPIPGLHTHKQSDLPEILKTARSLKQPFLNVLLAILRRQSN